MNDENIEIEEEQIIAENESDPFMSEPFDPVKIQIQPKQDTLRNIIERLRHGEIDMNTDFQRHADLWTSSKMSRLIESILIRFPLPAFYFDASNDDNWLVVDGLQRLSSIRKFVVDKKLKLSGLEYLKDLNGYSYEALPRQYKRRIDECSITMFQIMPGTPTEVKYSVFRRINTGGLVLNNQEIRNALATPKEREYLEKLSQNEFLIKAIGDQSRRMVDQELVLRFLSFYKNEFIASKKSIAPFLDDGMAWLSQATEEELSILSKTYHNAIRSCYLIFDEYAFEKRLLDDDSKRKRKNSTIFEVLMVEIANLSEMEQELLISRKETFIVKFSLLISNDDFYKSVTFSTQKHEHVKIRYSKVNELIKEVLHD